MHPASPTSRLAWLAGPLPVVVLLACYLMMGLSATSRKSMTFDEGAHLTGGVVHWMTRDYRIAPENGNWSQRWAALPVWLTGCRLPAADSAHWKNALLWRLSDAFLYDSGNDADTMLWRGRVMIGLLGVPLGLLIYLWSRRLFGAPAGLLSLAVFVFSPAMLSNGFLVTSDMAVTVFFTAACWAMWALLHRLSLWTFAAAAFSLAGVILTKYSGVLIMPMGLLMLGIRLCNPAPLVLAFGKLRDISGRARQLGVFALVGVGQVLAVALIVWATFGFRFSMAPPGADAGDQRARTWQTLSSGKAALNHFVHFARDHRLLPEGYLFGFMNTLDYSKSRASFLNGVYNTQGRIEFFPYCMAVKTPPSLFILLGLALASAWWRHRHAAPKDDPPRQWSPYASIYGLTPLLVLIVVYWSVAILSTLNIGHRHQLPIHPPLFILAGAAACWLGARRAAGASVAGADAAPSQAMSTDDAGPRPWGATPLRIVVIVATVSAIVESVWFWPHYLAYFSPLAGGPRSAYRHLVDSSLDWGQDLPELKRWLARDAEQASSAAPRRVYLSYFGTARPEYYAIPAELLPCYIDTSTPRLPPPLSAGTYCISATMLQNVYLSTPGRWNRLYEAAYQQNRQMVELWRRAATDPALREKLSAGATPQLVNGMFQQYEHLRFARLCGYLRTRQPEASVGYSILVYRLTDAELHRALDGAPAELLDRPEARVEEEPSPAGR